MMNDAQFKSFISQLEVQMLREDLAHPRWVVLVWETGIGTREPNVYGPLPSELAGTVFAQRIRAQLLSAVGRTWAFGNAPVDTMVLPMWTEEEAEVDA
jgi:hypothetical protein